ncbi:hypothetical protein H0O02_04095 [Candidatus Micrarchaeota archaeon]|nr:hypothetical protein [Candidatus Micrarchaeota archaeon]
MSKKGQYFSFDAIIASVIFMMALVLLLSYWHSVKVFLDYQTSDVIKESMRIASLLFVPAYPEGVGCGSIQNLGFAVSWEDKRVDKELLACAYALSGAELKEKLGTPYNVSITVTYLDDGTWFMIGNLVPSDAREVVNMRRAATVYGASDESTRLATVDVSVYR